MSHNSSSSSSSSESVAPTKEEEERKTEDVAEKKKKKKKQKRRYFPGLPKAWTFPRSRPKPATEDGKDTASDTSFPGKENKKGRYARKRLPFMSREKDGGTEEPTDSAAGITQDDSAVVEVHQELDKIKLAIEDKIAELSGEEAKQNIPSGPSDADEKEALASLMTEAVLKAQDTDVRAKIDERAVILSQETSEDEVDLVIATSDPDGLKDEWEKKVPFEEAHGSARQVKENVEKKVSLKELFVSVNQAPYGVISSLSQNKFCAFVYDISLGKLIGWCSFVVDRASHAVKGFRLFILSSLINRYPQCFKAQLKEIKRRSKSTKGVKVQMILQEETKA
ncbi:uncharacterized protein LOC114968552 [Acropora millepora]|uniref:uncharacterized protein LOC114968552 n=1 Tax=Acropora millepora TaxID=45264 RepID=UPI001CF49019|nr:uncharacterized protein LOC114968552 [Acropora millepora]XP_044164235.1 uncharacterized protein LOC114968552 [Acropora millepora]